MMHRNVYLLVMALFTGGVAGAAPVLVVNAPPSGATNVGSAVTLDLGVSGATGATTVTFYGRKTAPATPGPDFVLGTLPDTQYYSQNTGGTRAAIFHAQTQWYLDNRAALNLAFVSHMGDFVQNGDNSGNPVEWQVADGAMARIENRISTLSAFGIPWGGAPGNHDTSPIANPTGTSTFFNQYFGEARFAGREFYRGHYGTNNNNNYEFFSASGLDFIIIHLTYRTATLTTGEQQVLDWADALLKAHPNRRAIVTSHWILGTGNPAPFQGPGQRIYDNLKDNPNLFLLLCGHVHGTGRRTDVFSGNTVHAVLQDFQDEINGGDGWLRYFIFSPANNTISARTFSPTRNGGAGDSRTDSAHQFTLAYNQQGAITDWIPLGTVNLPAGVTSATLPWTGLETDSNYEWYVTATDSSGAATTPARRFATVAAQPPMVALTAPAGGATFTAPATISLAATATDADGAVARVEFYQGTTKLGEDTTGPSYDFTWTGAAAGSYVLSAVAVDNLGRGTLSSVVNITVNPGAGGGSFTFAENFNSMGASGTAPPAGWSIKNGPSGTSTSTWTSNIPGTGSNSVASMVNASGGLTASSAPTATNNNGFNAGAPGNTANRMLATSPTSNAGSAIQLQLTNPSAGSISQLLVGYDLQRFTTASSANELPGYRLFYSLDSGVTWTNVAALNPAISGSTGVVVPNTTGVTTVAPYLVTLGSPWAAGATLLFRWVDDNAAQSSPDQVLGLDNVTVATPGVTAQPPTISDIANQTMNEDTTTGGLAFTVGDLETPVGSLTVSGSSSNPALVPNANIVFGGSGASRTVTVTPVANQSGTATITVTVSDGAATATDAFVLTVNAVNDSPTISDLGNLSIDEDTGTAPLGFTVGDVETAAGSLAVSGSSSNPALVPNANIVFGGSGGGRTVTVTPVVNQSGTATITVTVSDGGATTADTFLLTVNAVNDAPTITGIGSQTTTVNTPTAAINFSIGDLETPAAGLTVSGTSSDQALVPDAGIIFNGSGASRTVTINPAAGQTGTVLVTITVSDGSEAVGTSFALTVNSQLNTPPAISDIVDQAIDEEANTGELLFTVEDAETAAGSLVVSAISSNSVLVPDTGIVFGGNDSDRTMIVTPAANQSGTATITVTVTDGTAITTDTFVLTVNPVNDLPTISDVADQTIGEDAVSAALPFTVGDMETPAGSLTVSGSSSNPALVPDASIVFGGSGPDRTVAVTPIANQSGTATLTVTVSDGTATATDTFLLTVNAINDPPTISGVADQLISEDAAIVALPFTVGDVETAADSLVVSGSSSNPALVPNGGIVFGGSGGNRTVTVTPIANQSGTATITVTVSDGTATATNTFLLTVGAVNDLPTISDLGNQTIDEDTSSAALAFTVGDPETAAGSLAVSGSSSNPALVPSANIVFGGSGASRTVTVTPIANQSGTATITVTVSDGMTTTSDTFLLTVNAVNDTPAISDIADQATNEGTSTAALPLVVGDVETAAGSLIVSGASSNTVLVPNTSIVFGGSGTNRTVTITPAANQSGTATITVSVSDGVATAMDTFLLTVNAAPPPSGTFSFFENFDSLGLSGTTPPPGWSIKTGNSGSSPSSWTTTIPGTGSNSVAVMVNASGVLTANNAPTANNNNGYNAGTPGNTANRLLATAPTTNSGSAIQLQLTNTSDGPITQLRLSYDIRRFTAPATANELPGYRLFYSQDSGTTWTNVTVLNPVISGGTGVVVPNTTGVTPVPLTALTLGAAWTPGATLLFRWVDDNAAQTSIDQVLGLDNVTITTPLPPTIALTAPGTDAIYVAPASLVLTAGVSDTEGVITTVGFFAGATKLGEDTTAPYSFNWNGATAGTYALTAVATTNTGGVLTSGAVNLTVLADTDADGLPDAYESGSGLNPNNALDGNLDLDGDLLSNRLEYALGMPANVPNRTGLPLLGVGNGADSGKLTFTFNRQRYELTYTVLASNDLKTWTNLAINPGAAGSVVTVTDNNTSSPNRYLRLAVTDGVSTTLTVPVGRITYALSQNQMVFLGFPLHDMVGAIGGQPAGFITGIGANTLDNANAGWTPGQLAQTSTPYFVRITRGVASGRIFPIATDLGSANTATRLTLVNGGVDLTALGIVPGVDTYELFPADTLNSMFPAGTLLAGSLTTGDTLSRWNGVAVVAHYFDGANWREEGGGLANNFVLPANEGWALDRRGSATTFTLLGQAPSTDATAVVSRGTISVISLLPVDRTFAEFPLHDLVPGWASNPANPPSGDHVMIWNGSYWDIYYFDGTKWMMLGGGDASNTLLIKTGRSFLIVRPAGTGSDIRTQPRSY